MERAVRRVRRVAAESAPLSRCESRSAVLSVAKSSLLEVEAARWGKREVRRRDGGRAARYVDRERKEGEGELVRSAEVVISRRRETVVAARAMTLLGVAADDRYLSARSLLTERYASLLCTRNKPCSQVSFSILAHQSSSSPSFSASS
jgi:hypothetical protein